MTIVRDRKLNLCDTIKKRTPPELVVECPMCGDFLLYCCSCNKSRDPLLPCHHCRIVFTDGACTDNGKPSAKAGVGVAYRSGAGSQISVPITDLFDNFPLRSNQRAELLAAHMGLVAVTEANRADKDKAYVVATDSEYVVRGITEWLPIWKRNGWRTSKGTKPLNLDLFLELDKSISMVEADRKAKVGFWHIPRAYNTIADELAKRAAVRGSPATVK